MKPIKKPIILLKEDIQKQSENLDTSELLSQRNAIYSRVGLILYVRGFAFVIGVLLFLLSVFVYTQGHDLFKLIVSLISASVPFIVMYLMTRSLRTFERQTEHLNKKIANNLKEQSAI